MNFFLPQNKKRIVKDNSATPDQLYISRSDSSSIDKKNGIEIGGWIAAKLLKSRAFLEAITYYVNSKELPYLPKTAGGAGAADLGLKKELKYDQPLPCPVPEGGLDAECKGIPGDGGFNVRGTGHSQKYTNLLNNDIYFWNVSDNKWFRLNEIPLVAGEGANFSGVGHPTGWSNFDGTGVDQIYTDTQNVDIPAEYKWDGSEWASNVPPK